jgi:hypothetical protein
MKIELNKIATFTVKTTKPSQTGVVNLNGKGLLHGHF